MSFNKPHSFAPVVFKRQRPRRYPWIFQTRKSFQKGGFCEACNKPAQFIIDYEASHFSSELSTMYLCHDHEKLTRYGKFDQVFRDMNRKIENGL
jgi:hypothetical protein